MDATGSIWYSILEFVLQERVNSGWANAVIATIPPSFLSVALEVDPSVKKTLLLCSLEDDLQRGSITLRTLKTLELIEEIDLPDDLDYMMCLAYWAVAAHCTAQSVRDDEEGTGGEGNFKGLVDRLWRGRVGGLMQSNAKIGILSANLYEWYECLVMGTTDAKTRNRVMQSITVEKTEEKAKDLLGQYVREARRALGPSAIQREYEKICKAEANGSGTRRETSAAVPGASKDAADPGALSSRLSPGNLDQSASVEETQKPADASTDDPLAALLEGHGRDMIAPVLEKDGGRRGDYCGYSSSAKKAKTKDGSQESPGGDSDKQDEWDNDTDEMATPEESPKWKNVKPVDLPKYKKNKRRTPRKWSAEEEHTLIQAVKRFGKGEWKTILDGYRSVFHGRTEVDLKDKWRNMIKRTKRQE